MPERDGPIQKIEFEKLAVSYSPFEHLAAANIALLHIKKPEDRDRWRNKIDHTRYEVARMIMRYKDHFAGGDHAAIIRGYASSLIWEPPVQAARVELWRNGENAGLQDAEAIILQMLESPYADIELLRNAAYYAHSWGLEYLILKAEEKIRSYGRDQVAQGRLSEEILLHLVAEQGKNASVRKTFLESSAVYPLTAAGKLAKTGNFMDAARIMLSNMERLPELCSTARYENPETRMVRALYDTANSLYLVGTLPEHLPPISQVLDGEFL